MYSVAWGIIKEPPVEASDGCLTPTGGTEVSGSDPQDLCGLALSHLVAGGFSIAFQATPSGVHTLDWASIAAFSRSSMV
jgi:hypothetical protein